MLRGGRVSESLESKKRQESREEVTDVFASAFSAEFGYRIRTARS